MPVWTEEQKETVRRMYRTHTREQMAAVVGHSAGAVGQMVYKLGIERKYPWTPRTKHEEIKRWYDEGLNDYQIAAKVGLKRETVGGIRRRLGLPVNEAGLRDARRRAVASQLRTMGVTQPAGLRTLAFQRFATERGWPAELPPRAVQILEFMAVTPRPVSRVEMAAALGFDVSKFSRTSSMLKHRNRTYVSILQEAGLIICLPRVLKFPGKGKGYSQNLYTLSPIAIEIILKRASEHGQAEPDASNLASEGGVAAAAVQCRVCDETA